MKLRHSIACAAAAVLLTYNVAAANDFLPTYGYDNTEFFKEFQMVNPEAYAYIEIPGTKVDYPIMQSKTNDKKYLTTNPAGNYYVGGSIFTESKWNSDDFSDPVTIIYGHTMKSGTLFGSLENTYSDYESFLEHPDVWIYLPEGTCHYTVFAAVPFESYHLMSVYDFNSPYMFDSFFKTVYSINEPNANFDYSYYPEYGDHIIIMSTCMNADSTHRYLVMAVMEENFFKIQQDLEKNK